MFTTQSEIKYIATKELLSLPNNKYFINVDGDF